MFKKISVIFCIFLMFFCGCSKENKFGIEQFVERLNNQYEYNLNTADFILGTNENGNRLFYENGNRLISVSLNDKNNIDGISLLVTAPEKVEDIVSSFCHLSSILTGNDYIDQYAILSKCGVSVDKIKFADNSFVATIGKYKYTVVCNEYSITFFCDRV